MANAAAPTMATPITFDSPIDTSNLRDRSVLITGAASGIGLACAIKMAEAGAIVTMSDLQEVSGHAAAQDLSSKGLRVQFIQCDVMSYSSLTTLFQAALRFGNDQIDIVIPNAGVLTEKSLFDMLPSELPNPDSPPPPPPAFSCLEVNLLAVYNTCYLALHYFRLPRVDATTFKPAIVLMASLAGYIGYPSSATYSMSKFGIRGLFYSIRERALRSGIRVNLVAPWYVDTGITKQPDFLENNGPILEIIGFASMDRVVDAVCRFVVDQALHGRAIGIFPRGDEDLGDDLEGAYGGTVLGKHMREVALVVRQIRSKVTPGAQGAEGRGNSLPTE
jgi:5'-hydroxyaverantin dehydrogenase